MQDTAPAMAFTAAPPAPANGYHPLDIKVVLSRRLVSAVELQRRIDQERWIALGSGFVGIDKLFTKLGRVAESCVDQIAGRIVRLGGVAEATVCLTADPIRPAGDPSVPPGEMAHVEVAALAFSAFGREAHSAIDAATALRDAATAEMFLKISHTADKWVWLLETLSREEKGRNGAKASHPAPARFAPSLLRRVAFSPR